MIGHTARFGYVRGAHGLIDTTHPDGELVQAIRWHTDAPPHATAGRWEPYFSGYAFRDHYIVQHTSPDDAAPRAGMVRTDAILFPLEDVRGVELDALFERLEPVVAGGPGVSRLSRARLGGVVDGLLAEGRVVWVGQHEFAATVAALWTTLALEDRARLVFGLALHPEPVPYRTDSSSLQVICVPATAVARFADWWQVPLQPPPESNAATAILDPASSQSEREIATALSIGTPTLLEWRYLTAAVAELADLDSQDPEPALALAGLLAVLAPEPTVGVALKRKVLDRIEALIPRASLEYLGALRSMQWAAMPGPSRTTRILEAWARNITADGGASMREAVAATVAAQDPWTQKVLEALQTTAKADPAVTRGALVVAAMTGDRPSFLWLLNLIAPTAENDQGLATALGGRSETAWIASEVGRNWPIVHAAVVDVTNSEVAWTRQLKFNKRVATADATLEARIGAAGTVRAAISIGAKRLVERAVVLAIADPTVLEPAAPAEDVWLQLVAGVVDAGGDPWGVVDPVRVRDVLLGALLDGMDVQNTIITSLACTRAADVSTHERRADLWRVLPASARGHFLRATARSVARMPVVATGIPEPELEREILDTAVLGDVAHADPSQAVALLAVLPAARGGDAVTIATRGRFDELVAAELGSVVSTRRWAAGAADLVHMARRRMDLRPASAECAHLLSIADRFRERVGWTSGPSGEAPPADQMRDMVHDVVVTLYPTGPGHEDIWERAGGDPADLRHDGSSGRRRWEAALAAVHESMRGAPTLVALLDEMLVDFPKNVDLIELRRLA